MEDFSKRSIDELIEEFPQFVEEFEEIYNEMKILMDIIFSSCSIEYKIQTSNEGHNYKVFDSFFEYQFPKIFEKYKYFRRILKQMYIINLIYCGIHDKVLLYLFIIHQVKEEMFSFHIKYDNFENLDFIYKQHQINRIEVPEKYREDLRNMFRELSF